MAIFRGESGSVIICSTMEPLGLVERGILLVQCPSRHPTISVDALNGTQSINPYQWPGLILSSSTTGLLIEGVLVFDART